MKQQDANDYSIIKKNCSYVTDPNEAKLSIS